MKIKNLRLLTFTLALLQLSFHANAGPKVLISELSWIEKNAMERQVEQINELAKLKLGTQIHADKSDLELLQRIIYKGLIKRDDTTSMQAMGVVLGNVMVANFGLQWKSYEDSIGVSKAACIPNTNECVFPVTMLSRRMEVGLLPDVEKIYSEVKIMIEPFLPKRPFSDL